MERENIGNNNIGNCNTGRNNMGNYNTGIHNTGSYNTGLFNIGSRNSGSSNTGSGNSGNYNAGNCNSGDSNTGDYNTGDNNIGNCNSGDWNVSSNNSGCFMTEKPKISMFNRPSEWTYEDWAQSGAKRLLSQMPEEGILWTDAEEKELHSGCEAAGGYIDSVYRHYLRQKWWNALAEEEKETVKTLPNFDAEIFWKCTGIRVEE